MNGVHITRCTQIGGENSISTIAAKATTISPKNQDHEHRRAVAGILCRQVEPAYLTSRPHAQQTVEETPAATARTAASERRAQPRNCRITGYAVALCDQS